MRTVNLIEMNNLTLSIGEKLRLVSRAITKAMRERPKEVELLEHEQKRLLEIHSDLCAYMGTWKF
jgi:hypothetical protein